MSSMKAAVLTEFGSVDKLTIQEVLKPYPKPHQVLVRVYATSINPVDYQTRRGDYPELVKLPVILGVDISGVVEAVGESVTNFQIGDEVYYSPQLFGKSGSYAEYHVADERIVAHKPVNISHIEAACFPLAAGTAWECLVTRGKLQVGESVLIHAGAGGVGSFAIGLAKAMGAFVYTTLTAWDKNLTVHFVFTSQQSNKLKSLKRLIELQQLFPIIDCVMPLVEVAKAHQYLEQGGIRGKVVLQIFED